MTTNRIGGTTKDDRPMTPYERGQMITHYPTVGPTEMARRLHRTVASVKYHWSVIRAAGNPSHQFPTISDHAKHMAA